MSDLPPVPGHAIVPQPLAVTEPVPVADLPLAGYELRSPAHILASLRPLSQRDLRTIDVYESLHANRAEIREGITALTGVEPWIGYDRQETQTIMHFLLRSSARQARDVHAYERAHRDRSGIVGAASARLGEQPA
jgi:hypothetical protein